MTYPIPRRSSVYLKLMSRKTLAFISLSLFVPLLIAQQATEHIDLNIIHRIKTAELGGGGNGGGGGGRGGGGRGGANRVPIMETLYNLTDRYGPRLTNSPQFRAAGDWAVGQLKEWGLSNVHLEPFTTQPPPAATDTAEADAAAGGGRGGAAARRAAIPSWEMVGYSGAMVEPTFMPIIGYPQAWSGGTNGPLTAEAVMVPPIQTMADMDKLHGKLMGKMVLTVAELDLPLPTAPMAHRYTDDELNGLVPEVFPAGGRGGGGRGGNRRT